MSKRMRTEVDEPTPLFAVQSCKALHIRVDHREAWMAQATSATATLRCPIEVSRRSGCRSAAQAGFARGHATYRDRPRLRCKNEAGFEKIDAGVMPLESGPESFEASVLTGREEPNTSPALGEGGLAHLRKRDKERMWR